MLFACMTEISLLEASLGYDWGGLPKLYPDMPYEDCLFMDDGLLWGPNTPGVGRKLENFAVVLGEYGLKLNPVMCSSIAPLTTQDQQKSTLGHILWHGNRNTDAPYGVAAQTFTGCYKGSVRVWGLGDCRLYL